MKFGEYDSLEQGWEAWEYFVTSYYDHQKYWIEWNNSRARSRSRTNAWVVQKPWREWTGELSWWNARIIDSIWENAEKWEISTNSGNNEKDYGAFKEISSWIHLNTITSQINKRKLDTQYSSGNSLYESDIRMSLQNALRKNGHKSVKIQASDIYGVYTLDNFIEHKKLFEKYPSLKNTEIVLADFHTDKKRGLNIEGKIFLNKKNFEKNKNLAYSTLVHEIEHILQGIRGEIEYGDFGKIANKDIIERWARAKQNDYLEKAWEKRLEDIGYVNKESYNSTGGDGLSKAEKRDNLNTEEFILNTRTNIHNEISWWNIKLWDWELRFSIERNDDDNYMIIDNIEVITQKNGIWTKLMRKAEQIAFQQELDRIELWAYPQNDSITSDNLLKFYDKLWYEINEESEFDGTPYYDISKSPSYYSDEEILQKNIKNKTNKNPQFMEGENIKKSNDFKQNKNSLVENDPTTASNEDIIAKKL